MIINTLYSNLKRKIEITRHGTIKLLKSAYHSVFQHIKICLQNLIHPPINHKLTKKQAKDAQKKYWECDHNAPFISKLK